MLFLRTAPSVDAGILSVMQAGATFEVDIERRGWVRTVKSIVETVDEHGRVVE